MANYYALARTNYVRVKDLDGLKASIEAFAIRMFQSTEDSESWTLISESESGWPAIYPNPSDPHADAQYLDFRKDVCPYLYDGEVLVSIEVGREKSRYGIGIASAMMLRGDQWYEHVIDLNSIYNEAAEMFGVTQESITRAEY
jgi:hypothetical protein